MAWPSTVVVDVPFGRAYILGSVPDHQAHALAVLDTRTATVVRTLHRIGQPTGSLIGAALDAATHHLFVANNGTVLNVNNRTPRPSVEMLDARTGRLLRTIPANPRAMQIDAGQARLYITDESGAVNCVHVVDTNTGAIVRTDTFPQFQGTSSVQQLALDTPAQRVIVASYVPGVTILDARTGRILRSRQVPNGTTQLVVDERAGRVVAAGDYGVGVLDSQTGAVVHTLTPDDVAHVARSHETETTSP